MGELFLAWSVEGPAPDTAVPIGRFQSAWSTADAAECQRLQSADSGWQYEGIAFQALVLREDGVCPTDTKQVWRLYNNRFAEQDSNHHFMANSETYRTMIADGWIGEGVAFCSPPTAKAES